MNFTLQHNKNFTKWYLKQAPSTKKRIDERLKKIAQEGHLGDFRYLGDGLSELKFNIGIRIYFFKTSITGLLLVGGSKKNDQNKTIQRIKKNFL